MMQKIISIFTILIFSISSVVAQTNYKTVKGYVVDKNGNPIPGAEVMTPGGGESVITDADGSFSMSVHPLLKKLTATYDGMTTKTIKLTPENKDFVFTLKKERVNPAFLNILINPLSINMKGDVSYNYEYTQYMYAPSIGIMAGMLGRWGFYGKVILDIDLNFNITAGIIKSINKNKIFIYAGLGYGMAQRYYTYEYYDQYYRYDYDTHTHIGAWRPMYSDDYRPGIAADLGFIFKVGHHFNLTVGYNLIGTFPFTTSNWLIDYNLSVGPTYVHGLQVGFGYVF